ncbi:elongin-B-like [Patiria miniata]|uniref:Elongin-B n=1 Tax=Patiria miniata TaxID=46514 RepID=A0A913ZQ32_PATMI|nr:elongin-B-like [Patiria miniata]
MDVFLMIRRKNWTIFTDAKETSTVYELKRIIEGIIKRSPEDQKLFKDKEELDNTKTLADCGLTSNTAKAQAPAMLGLACKLDGDTDEFETLDLQAYSNPPELPDVMKSSEPSTTNTVEPPVS